MKEKCMPKKYAKIVKLNCIKTLVLLGIQKWRFSVSVTIAISL